jgi:hypothetical protein
VAERVFSKLRTGLDPKVASQLQYLNENWMEFEDEMNYLNIVAGTSE